MIFLYLSLFCCSVYAQSSFLPVSLTLSSQGDALTLKNGFVSTTLSLTHFSIEDLRGRLSGDGDFSSSPNLAGAPSTVSPNTRRGALAVVIGDGMGGSYSTSDATRSSPLPFVILANTSTSAAFSVTGTDSRGHLSATFSLSLDASSRGFVLNASSKAITDFRASLVSLSLQVAAPSAQGWYTRGARQGMRMGGGLVASASPLLRWYALGTGAQGGCEVVVMAAAATSSNATGFPGPSYLLAGSRPGGMEGGVGLALWGTPSPLDNWVGSFDGGGAGTAVAAGDTSPLVSLALFPNDYAFPPSSVPSTLPPRANLTDIASILAAAHGSAVAALHSYDYSPEVRAAPCLAHDDQQCYAPNYNFYDPDSAISNSVLLYSFEPSLHEQVRGQLETNMRYVCDGTNPAMCSFGQCIHHYTGSCAGGGAECFCATGPGGVQDCAVYDALSGAVQTGPNVFTLFAALRYAGATGNASWASSQAPSLRAMMAFLDERFNPQVGLYLAPGSLQIDVFIRQNYTADSNAMGVLLCDLFADFEEAMGNATGAALYSARADTIRAAMNEHLLADDGSHYCTQSDPGPGGQGVVRCTRDFIDYDANSIAVAARVPTSTAAAGAVLARMDRGTCTHARATYVSEIEYGKKDCVNGNNGDSAVTMGRIGWQDALARQAVGTPEAAAVFESVLLAPLQLDLLARTWLPERYDCQGKDAHNAFYFEYASTVGLMLYEVRYGISLRMTKVIVNPLSAKDFDFSMGFLSIGYNATAVSAALGGGHSGTRKFEWHGMAQGAWTVTATSGSPTPASVGADGILSFAAPVGPGVSVAATKD